MDLLQAVTRRRAGALVLLLVAGLAGGCGTGAITSAGGGDGGSQGSSEAGVGADASPPDTAATRDGGCTPATCAALGKNCGAVSDGCGTMLSCGTCAAPETCGGGSPGVANVCGVGPCTPTTCSAEGKNCGTIGDDCGGTLECGTCTAPESCGGGGTPNVCGGCTPGTCVTLGKNCGSISDGCGGTLECGSCTTPETCGGGGIANVCGELTPDDIIPPARRTIWQPGVTYNGGIPNRTTIYKTLSPSGGDDTAAIQAALDSCPTDQVVKLAAGTFNINGNGLNFRTSHCTLRGSGTGTPGSGAGGTRLVKADRGSNRNYAVMYMGANAGYGASINLAADAVQGAYSVTLASNPGIQVGEIVLLDHVTNNDPSVYWGPDHDPPGGGSRRWFCRQDRSLAQMLEVTAVNGNAITFATPIHVTHPVSFSAQLTRYAHPPLMWSGVEDLYIYGGMGGDYHGNLALNYAAYSWIKNIEAHWSVGTSVGLYSTYRCEVRDSYIHETPDPNPGGAGYLSGINVAASDNLMENNIMWYGNKVVVMRAAGGGNVFAYNYTDDSFGSGYPSLGEAGINAGHYTTTHMELLEGNYSPNFKGDSFWGSSLFITVFRNHLSAKRAAHRPLDTYTSGGSPYIDGDRVAADLQYRSDYHNLVGNVLGAAGQTLIHSGGVTQTAWLYEALDGFAPDGVVPMWSIGAQQTNTGWSWFATTYETQLRDGNWDWVTQSQRWHGIGGAVGAGTPKTIPDSLYLSAKPAFFGSNPWPWVDPATGTVYTLPAKARFEAIPLANFPAAVSFQ
jgi:hypothetical protein